MKWSDVTVCVWNIEDDDIWLQVSIRGMGALKDDGIDGIQLCPLPLIIQTGLEICQ